MTDPTDSTISPDEFNVDEWIAGATLGQTSIDVYAQPGLFAEWEKLERDLKVAQESDQGEESLEDSAVADIEARMVEIYEQWMASKSTWTVRALPKVVARKLSEEHPEVAVPDDLAADADETAKAKHVELMAAFEAQSDARNYAILEQTVVRIEAAGGKVRVPTYADDGVTIAKPAVTAAQLTVLRTRLGEVQLIRLIQAGKTALTREPVIPAPFLRPGSSSDPTSRSSSKRPGRGASGRPSS